jgi:hypothetical protein
MSTALTLIKATSRVDEKRDAESFMVSYLPKDSEKVPLTTRGATKK